MDVAELIRAMAPNAVRQHRLHGVLQAVGLAILGQDVEVYDAYAQAIRAEHSALSDHAYQQQRLQMLSDWQRLAESSQLYREAYFAGQYNETARLNVQREITRLQLT